MGPIDSGARVAEMGAVIVYLGQSLVEFDDADSLRRRRKPRGIRRMFRGGHYATRAARLWPSPVVRCGAVVVVHIGGGPGGSKGRDVVFFFPVCRRQ